MIRIGILGASGYTARELLRLLLRHPEAEVCALTTRQEGSPHVGDVHPALRGRLNLSLESLSAGSLAERCDFVFSCLPHAASAGTVSQLLDAGLKVVDFSADYRLTDAAVYEQWYKVEHPDKPRLGAAPYGLPELFREAIRAAPLVANPGCYPTAAILGLAPLLKAGVVSPGGIVIDAKSGVTGAGRTAKPHLHFPECNEGVSPYGVGSHRHTPEIDQVLSACCGSQTEVVFTPHLIPMDRGELITAYAEPAAGTTTKNLLDTLRASYRDEPFVRVLEDIPGTKGVAHTNYCDVSARVVRGKAVVVAAIDNLIKGASGAAVQNFNVMQGFDETTALD
ncbi:MAG: N-acetyl-gamma-glutamyl-phosphate reductase [Planctomycetota bacterium]